MNIQANIEAIKTTWNGYSTKKKYLIAGGALLLLAGLGNLNHPNGPTNGRAFGPSPMGYQAYNGQRAYMPQGNGQAQGGQGNGAGYVTNTGNAVYAGAGSYNHPDTTDLTSSYEYRNAVEDNASHNFQNYQLDRTDVQNVATGEVTDGVSNTYAEPAIASGTYEAAPAAPVAEPAAAPADDGN